jgi:chloramphenicol-sensitive protein RarD
MNTTRGVWYGVGAYVAWGLTPLFWNLVDDVGPINLLANRIVWSIPILAIILGIQRRFTEIKTALTSPRVFGVAVLAAAVLAINWGVWLHAVTSEQIVEASFGYFINPLVSVALGVLILGERLRRAQWVAVAIAAVGVTGMAISVGSLPWIALALAFSFGTYGLIKKRAVVPAPLISLSGEVLALAIPALVVLLVVSGRGDLSVSQGAGTTLFLVGTGIVTTVPLLLFGAAAKRIPLTTIGLLQYIAPSLQFLIGVLVYGENLSLNRLAWFGVVWIALGVYVWDSARSAANRSTVTANPVVT